jgi:two-component system, OmpR family, response regulator
MDEPEHMPIYSHDVFTITAKGRQELNQGSTELPGDELEVLVLLDGKLSMKEILALMPRLEDWELVNLIPKLIRKGFAAKASIADQDDLDFSYFFDAEKTVPTAELLEQSDVEAAIGITTLQRDGYYVSITRQNNRPQAAAGKKVFTILAVEDDPGISMLVTHVLKMEGYEARTAVNRAEVLLALRSRPSPDLVLLDVMLPDANGFDILERMKQHPVLKTIPVIMLTGEATRESVSRGLALGADGYITKPFDIAILRKGIKNVLGIDVTAPER